MDFIWSITTQTSVCKTHPLHNAGCTLANPLWTVDDWHASTERQPQDRCAQPASNAPWHPVVASVWFHVLSYVNTYHFWIPAAAIPKHPCERARDLVQAVDRPAESSWGRVSGTHGEIVNQTARWTVGNGRSFSVGPTTDIRQPGAVCGGTLAAAMDTRLCRGERAGKCANGSSAGMPGPARKASRQNVGVFHWAPTTGPGGKHFYISLASPPAMPCTF